MKVWFNIIIALLLSIATCTVIAGDWNSCQYELEKLERAAREAAEAAEKADSAQDELEFAKSIFLLCSEDCWIEKTQYDNAKLEYQSALTDLQMAFSDLNRAIKKVGNECVGK